MTLWANVIYPTLIDIDFIGGRKGRRRKYFTEYLQKEKLSQIFNPVFNQEQDL